MDCACRPRAAGISAASSSDSSQTKVTFINSQTEVTFPYAVTDGRYSSVAPECRIEVLAHWLQAKRTLLICHTWLVPMRNHHQFPDDVDILTLLNTFWTLPLIISSTDSVEVQILMKYRLCLSTDSVEVQTVEVQESSPECHQQVPAAGSATCLTADESCCALWFRSWCVWIRQSLCKLG